MLNEFYLSLKRGIPADKYSRGIDGKEVLKIEFETDKQKGITVNELLEIAYARLNKQNRKTPSRKVSIALTKIEEAVLWLAADEAESEAE